MLLEVEIIRAIQFDETIGRYLIGITLRKLIPGTLWSGLSFTFETDTAEPTLPATDWVKIKTRYDGICGTDMKSIHLDVSMYYSPLTDVFIDVEKVVMNH